MPIPQMQSLREKVIAYARLVEEMIVRSRTALIQGQPDLLAVVTEEDEPHANAFEVELEEEGIAVIARHQPMARELRTLLMILRITKDLERIADLATNIGEDVIYMEEGRVIKHHHEEGA